jgi:hypothetical protein
MKTIVSLRRGQLRVPMTRLICMLALSAVVVRGPGVVAQGPPAVPQMKRSASAVFEDAAVQASSTGFFGTKAAFEAMMLNFGLTKINEANWQGENGSGSVSVHAELPTWFGKPMNHFSVLFQPATETPIPQALLAHLLSKATETSVSGGDLIDIKLPVEPSRLSCDAIYTLRVRLTSGALVSNAVSSFCDVKMWAPSPPGRNP